MNDRSTFALVFVAVALACATIFFERDVSTTPYQAVDRYDVFRGLKADNLDRIVLVTDRGSAILKRGGNRWLFERPLGDAFTVKWEADADEVNRIINLLVNLREAAPAKVSTAGAPLDLMADGLDNPRERVEIVYGSQRGPISATLSLGRTRTLENGRTVRNVRVNDEDRILTIDNTLDQTMQLVREGGTEFRSRRVFPRDDLASTDQVVLKRPAYGVQLDQVSERTWKARWVKGDERKATVARCTPEHAKALGEAMQALRVERFVMDTAAEQDFAKYGILEPQAMVSLTLGSADDSVMALFSGPESADLYIGNDVEGAPDEVYAMAQRLPVIFTIKKSFLDALPKDPKETFPARRLTELDRNAVTSLTVKNGSGTLRAKREGFEWKVSAPLEIAGDSKSIDDLIKAATETDCDDILWPGKRDLSSFGLRNPLATITLGFGKGVDERNVTRLERLHFGKTFEKEVEVTKKVDDPDKQGEKKEIKAKEKRTFVYARRDGDAAIRIFPLEKMKTAFDQPTTYLRRRALEFDSFKARKLTLTRADGTWAFEKRKNEWFATAPVALKADQGNVGGLVSALGWLTGKSIVSIDPAELARYGLDQPTVRFVVEVEPEEKKEDKKEEQQEEAKEEKSTTDAPGEGDAPGKDDTKAPSDAKPASPVLHTILVTKKTDGDETTYYGHVVGQPLIFTLESDFTERLDQELIDTDVLPRAWSLAEASVTSAKGFVRLTRDANGQTFTVGTAAEGSLEPADKEKARGFFDKLGDIRVEGRYVSYDAKDMTPYGFEKPFATISTLAKDDTRTTAEFGGVADEAKFGQGMRYGRLAGKSAVFVVKQAALDAVLEPAAHYKPAAANEMGPPEKPDQAK